MTLRKQSRRTKIVCTLGPASSSLRTIRSLVHAGADVIRLNFSHGDHASHDALIENIRKVSEEVGRPIPIIQDLQGPRFRVESLKDGYMDLKRGMVVTVGGKGGGEGVIPIRPSYSFKGVKPGHPVVIGDIGTKLRVISVGRGKLKCRVVKGGRVLTGKGVQFPRSKAGLPALTEKDIADVKFGISRNVPFIALSFVRDQNDIRALRRLIGREPIGIIAKIETREAVAAIAGIIDQSDGILVARGDLAAEVSISRLPIIQKTLIEKSNRQAKPVITATQMLESMISSPQPTRAEASDVANAVLDGSDALMLSGETAVGKYPVDAVKTMASIVHNTEMAHFTEGIRRYRPFEPEQHVDEIIAYLAADAAHKLGASAIITSTRSGVTARRVAKFRPGVPILAVTPSRDTQMRLTLSHGVMCEQIKEAKGTDDMIRLAIDAARARRVVKKGDLVVVTAGVPPWVSGQTNLLKLETI